MNETFVVSYASEHMTKLLDLINEAVNTEIAPGLIALRVVSVSAMIDVGVYCALVVWEVGRTPARPPGVRVSGNASLTVRGNVYSGDYVGANGL